MQQKLHSCPHLWVTFLFLLFSTLFSFSAKKSVDLLARNLIRYSYIKLHILPKAECGSNRSEQQISAEGISLFPTRVLRFWDRVQRLDAWMQHGIHLGNPSTWFACISTQADFGNTNAQIRTRKKKKKAGSKHLSRLYNNLFWNFFPTHRF